MEGDSSFPPKVQGSFSEANSTKLMCSLLERREGELPFMK